MCAPQCETKGYKITFSQSIIYPAEKKGLLERAAFWHEVKKSRVGLPGKRSTQCKEEQIRA